MCWKIHSSEPVQLLVLIQKFKGARAKVWRKQWHPTPVLLPGKSHERRSLMGCSPWGHKELDRTEQLHFHFSLSCIGEGNGNPLQCSCLENPRDGGPWWAAVSGVAQSRTRLKWLRSSSSRTKVAAIVLAFPRWSQSGCCSSSHHICISDRKKGSMVSIRRRIFQKFVADFISHWIWTVKHSCA